MHNKIIARHNRVHIYSTYYHIVRNLISILYSHLNSSPLVPHICVSQSGQHWIFCWITILWYGCSTMSLYYLLKRKCHVGVTGCTITYRYDIFQCSVGWKLPQIFISVRLPYVALCTILCIKIARRVALAVTHQRQCSEITPQGLCTRIAF